MSSAAGVTLSIGATAGIAAYIVASAVIVPAVKQMTALSGASAGGPRPEELLVARHKITRFGQYVAVLRTVSVVTMAIAQSV